MAGDGIVHGATAFGLDQLNDALSDNTQWDQVNSELKGIQDSLNSLVTGIGQIESRLKVLAHEFKQQSDEIKVTVEAHQCSGRWTPDVNHVSVALK